MRRQREKKDSSSVLIFGFLSEAAISLLPPLFSSKLQELQVEENKGLKELSVKKMVTLPDAYQLTSLQIGDTQSYLSRIFLHFAPTSNKILILVDNRPWLMNKHSRSAKLWQLVVTKYRMSPFTNTRVQHMSQNSGNNSPKNCLRRSNSSKQRKVARWFSVIDAKKWQEKSLFPLMDLSKALHGFIAFEVAWKEVRGINYLNELQTDTSVALEVKSMKKWEFNSIDHSLSCLNSWFSGTISETQSLLHTLKSISNMESPASGSQHVALLSNNQLFQGMSRLESFSEDTFFDVQECPEEANDRGDDRQSSNNAYHPQYHLDTSKQQCYDSGSMLSHCEQKQSVKSMDMKEKSIINSVWYMDTLLLFRFNDGNLPFRLRQIITSDLRLLTLLESGLPSWAIFLQSYPILSKLYLPWMRPLARSLYILISLVTVIIGFYDLYKNVPLLKSTAASICGPLFNWIEAWEMISRLRYLGTMLFLQNFEKAIRWLLILGRMVKPAILLLTKPLTDPVMEVVEFIWPVWSMFAETIELYFSTVQVALVSSYRTILYLTKVLLSPIGLLYSYVRTMVKSVCPVFHSIWEILLIPIRFSLLLANYAVSLALNIWYLLRNVWQSTSGVMRLMSGPKPIGRSLWKDLFSKVFQAIRSIINGFIAFFSSCNRHRLSIYNHVTAFFRRLYQLLRLAPYACSCQRRQRMLQYQGLVDCDDSDLETELEECDFCK